MKKLEDLRIIFMGTPEFAVASLNKLVQAGCNIVAVITAPDKPGGRGMTLQQSDVKKYAVTKMLTILQPEKLKDPEFLSTLSALKADIQVVVAFRMLPEVVWNMPPMGSINLHGSLLPQYRGAAPINWAIINGEKQTGVTTFKLLHEIDTGNILMQQAFAIGNDDTAGDVHDRMKIIGAEVLLKTLSLLSTGNIQEQSQQMANEHLNTFKDTGILELTHTTTQPEILNHAPKIFTETCKIDWNRPTAEVFNLIRGLSPYPAAFTFLENKKLKIFKSLKENIYPTITPGELETDKKTFIKYATTDGYILIKELQLEGKKKMLTEDFLRGYKWE